MTRDRDIERVLDEFYSDGPSTMPDRLFLGVIDRIDRVPQRRLAFIPRFAAMTNNSRLAAAAAIVVAVVGIGALALSRNNNVASPPTPSPAIAVSPSPGVGASAPLPVALQGRWVGEPRLVPEAPEPPYRNALEVSDAQLGFLLAGQGGQTQFASTAALVALDQVRLRGATTDGGCQPRDEGLYSFKLDASGTALTLTSISDACAPRAAALAGDWAHVGCTEDQGWCLGNLVPGAHVSTIFNPFVPPSNWQYAYGKFEYAVPAGWASFADCPGCYMLARQGASEFTAVYLYSDIVPHAQDEACSESAEPGIGRTASAISAWLTTLPGLITTTPTPVTIGGLNGFSVDISVSPDWTRTCSYGEGKPIVTLLTDSDPAPGFDWNIGAGGYARYILLDLGDGRALVIDIESGTKADYDALLPEAMEVVNSFVFNR